MSANEVQMSPERRKELLEKSPLGQLVIRPDVSLLKLAKFMREEEAKANPIQVFIPRPPQARVAGEKEGNAVPGSRAADSPDDTDSAPTTDVALHQYVTLDQIAASVNRSKRTLERLKQQGKMPLSDVEGGGGKPDEWVWSGIRPWLEKQFGKLLPERFPDRHRR